MAKESGINYFYGNLGLNTGSLKLLYTFEEGAGTKINSISGGQAQYSGVLSSATNFWIKGGSGFFSGNQIAISNASGLASPNFTHLFIFEKVASHHTTIFNSQSGISGYKFGLTACNRVYFENSSLSPITAVSLNTLGTKNLISVGYIPNYLQIGVYNFTSRKFDIETFAYPFNIVRSDNMILGNNGTGFIDDYLYTTDFLSANVLNVLASGFYSVPTGTIFPVTSGISSGITGYASIPYVVTGVVGHTLSPLGFDGLGDFTGVFPTNNVYTDTTGILATGLYQSGVTGRIITLYTGTPITFFGVNTGYVSAFGMDKIVALTYIETGDILKFGRSYTPFDNNYNISLSVLTSGFQIPNFYNTGNMNLFVNGVAIANSGLVASGIYLVISGADNLDLVTLDLGIGGKSTAVGGSPFTFPYTGQELYFNGVNIISGVNFNYTAGNIGWIGTNTGISGVVFDYPIKLSFNFSNSGMQTGARFGKLTSNVYLNGIRQQLNSDYVEGSIFDRLSGNLFNNYNNIMLYDNDGNFWE